MVQFEVGDEVLFYEESELKSWFGKETPREVVFKRKATVGTIIEISRARGAGRSIPGHGNIVDKKISNLISRSVIALATFLEFSQTLETSFFEIFFVDLKNSKFSPRSITSEVSISPEILVFSVKYLAK